jgi:hypothetical protein
MSQQHYVYSFANDHAGCGVIGVNCIEAKTKPHEKLNGAFEVCHQQIHENLSGRDGYLLQV